MLCLIMQDMDINFVSKLYAVITTCVVFVKGDINRLKHDKQHYIKHVFLLRYIKVYSYMAILVLMR